MVISVSKDITEEFNRALKDFFLNLASILGVRVNKILNAFGLAKLAEILDIKYEGNEIIGIRLKIPSETRSNHFHYVMVGLYGFKCTCEASTIKKYLCKHVIAALLTWHVISLMKFGKGLELNKLEWLKEYGSSKRVEE